MIRIRRALVVLQVAGNAIGTAQVVIVVGVAIDALAWRDGVSATQREPDRIVIELRVEPVVGRVAGFTGSRELGGRVVRVRGCQVVLRVAGIALGRHGLEAAIGGSLVAGIAVEGCVSPGQRESIVVLLNLLDRDLPSPYGVALLAIGPQLALVNIGVAILAALPDVGEDHFDVALGAGNRGVHTTQWIARLVMVEFGNGSDRLPGVWRVAVLTGDGQVPVGTVRASGFLRSRARRESREDKDQNESEFCCDPSAHDLPLAIRSLPHTRKRCR